MDEVEACDKVFVMNGGSIIKEGTPEEIFRDKATLDKAGLELPIPAKIAERLRECGVKVGTPLRKEELLEALRKII